MEKGIDFSSLFLYYIIIELNSILLSRQVIEIIDFFEGEIMKIFEFDSPDDMKDGAVSKQVDGDGKPVAENEEEQLRYWQN